MGVYEEKDKYNKIMVEKFGIEEFIPSKKGLIDYYAKKKAYLMIEADKRNVKPRMSWLGGLSFAGDPCYEVLEELCHKMGYKFDDDEEKEIDTIMENITKKAGVDIHAEKNYDNVYLCR